ncbi:hypothetical protein ACJ41O_005617 [Fusarium nematophilum]
MQQRRHQHSMKAVVVMGNRSARLDYSRRVPDLRDDCVLVKPVAVALNPTDWRHVEYGRAKEGCILGCDYAGIVESAGSAVGDKWKRGDRIFGCAHGANLVNPDDGVFGEFAAVIGDLQMRLPESLSFEQAATIGLGAITVGQGLYQKALQLDMPGVSAKVANKDIPVLIYGGSTATGALGIQYAKQSGYTVITTCSSGNFDYVKSLGADVVVDYHDRDAGAKIREYTQNTLRYAWDTISIEASAKICAEALTSAASLRPVYGALLPVQSPREDVRTVNTVMHTVFGKDFQFGQRHMPGSREDHDFGKLFFRLTQEMLMRESGTMELRYDGQVAVVTGAGSGLGKAYAKFLASRGANVVVNDVGASLKGEGNNTKAADEVVKEIVGEGGQAVANYDSVEQGENVISTALSVFGRVDILINNAGILRDVSFKNMTDADWDAVNSVHVRGAYKTTHAAWSHFRKQRYGRIIVTSSAAGLYGNFGQCNYAAAKSAMIGFGETLAKEGQKYNIRTNIIAPVAASRMTATVMPPDLLEHLTPDWVVPLVSVLVHPKNDFENGSIFEVGGGHVSKLRWERANGALLRCDNTLTPGAVLAAWAAVENFSNAEHPNGASDMVAKLDASQKLPPSDAGQDIRFEGKVAVVTGGGAGLGRAYCLLLAKLGASVVVNDLVNPDTVVHEIRSFGGVAVSSRSTVEDGDAVIATAIDHFGRVDILINNAGILRDRSFQNMTDKMWDDINSVHLRGTYKCTKAAYPYMVKQKYGRIVNTASTSGIYGNFGQANYAASKTGIIGFSRALAIEGSKSNIQVNCVAPSAGTQLTQTVLSDEVVKARKPDFVAPFVVLLSSDKAPATATGQLFEVGCGWQGRIRLQRSDGVDFPLIEPLTPEKVLENWKAIISFTRGKAGYPQSTADSRGRIIANIERSFGAKRPASGPKEYLDAIERAKREKGAESRMSFTDKDTILYNLSLGATATQMPLVFEHSSDFQVLPTFGVIPGVMASRPFKLEDLVPNYSFKNLLHGEHFLEVREYPIPTSGTFVSQSRLVDVLDKGKASVAIVGTLTKDAATGKDIFYNELSLYLRGAGGFGGPATRSVHNEASAVYSMPDRKPDIAIAEKTSETQAALYRLNGDRNPLHIDPAVSKVAGFEAPILHGLCSFGISAKHLVATFGHIRNIKARFAGTVTPGQTLVTEMWKDGSAAGGWS